MISGTALSSAFEISSVYESNQRATPDEHWITAFAKDGGDAILSADKDFFRKPHQVVAVDDTGLRVIYLPTRWANAPRHLQAAHILMWWRRIEVSLAESKPREIWAVPWNVSEEGKLQRKKVDYGHYRKKLKKATRPSRRKVQRGG